MLPRKIFWTTSILIRFVAITATLFAASVAADGPSPTRQVARTAFSKGQNSSQLHNLRQIYPRVFVGGEPQDDADFAELERMGIRTVVSVDGTQPQVAAAKQYGLRYVHIPIGYDGISEEAGLALAQVVRSIKGPIYFHCHHGKHRGPAAAAIACLAEGMIDTRQAIEILEKSGTSRDYAGLWRDVEKYRIPPSDAVLPLLVETAQVSSFVAAMTQIDRSNDFLKLCQSANWDAPPDHPDLSPHQEALLLREGFAESRRHMDARYQKDSRSKKWFADAEHLAQTLEESLAAGDHSRATEALGKLGTSCQQCHEAYRN